mgnify:CR=1 FL=1
MLERVTIDDYPIIDEIKQVMMDSGALNAMMSGSGPTVFGIFTEEKMAEAARKVKPKYNIVGLRERMRTLTESYMAGNKTDDEYVNESIEIKGLIAKAEQESPAQERDLTPLKKLLDDEGRTPAQIPLGLDKAFVDAMFPVAK